MLRFYHSPSGLDISCLFQIYNDCLPGDVEDLYNSYGAFERYRNAENDFFESVFAFFSQKDAVYAVLEVQSQFVAALRMEPYQNGVIIAGLETRWEARRNGYATILLTGAVEYLRNRNFSTIYSHVHKQNYASLRTHEKVGFKQTLDYAVFLDGSVSHDSYTLTYKF